MILLWFLSGDARLGAAAGAILADATASLVLPAICLAEACWMIERGRVRIGPLKRVLDQIRNDPRIVVDPLDRELVEWTTRIGWRAEMHDRQIVCAALRLAARGDTVDVLRADAEIRGSGLVSIVW